MNQTIALNLQPLAADNLTGIGVYTREICCRLPIIQDEEKWRWEGHIFDFLRRNDACGKISNYLKPLTETELLSIKAFSHFPLGVYIRSRMLSQMIPYENLLASDANLTVFFNYLRPRNMKARSIITVYDMVAFRYPETMEKRNRQLLEKHLSRSCEQADKIITISDFSKREIRDCLGINEDKIVVAPCGVKAEEYYPLDEEEQGEAIVYLKNKYHIEGNYFLYLGTLEPRKNLLVMLDAFEQFCDNHKEKVSLVIAGGLGWQYEGTLQKINTLSKRYSIIRTGYIAQTDKRFLYGCAKAFIFPPIYEGFGLPPLEALACGTPVICSKCSSLPEVVGDHGILCDPQSSEEFYQGMSAVYHGISQGKKELLQQHALQFSWEKSAQIYHDSIANLL